MLPFYGVFDNLAYRVSPDGTVTLMGQVVRPTLKSDAENVVKRIEGVERVDNQIKVLPTSPMDDQTRMAVYRAIYGNAELSMYAVRAVPPIHIIVENGHVTLEAVVARQMDKQIAEMQAKSVPNVFSVTNNLRVEEQGSLYVGCLVDGASGVPARRTGEAPVPPIFFLRCSIALNINPTKECAGDVLRWLR